MTKGFIAKLFSYNGSLQFLSFSDEMVKAGYQHKFVVGRYIDHMRNKRVLDVGCWTGPIAKAITEQKINTELIGIDENEEALNVAKKNFSEFKFIKCELTQPSEEFINKYKSYFNTIIFLDVIEHLPKGSEVKVMIFFNEILKPDGVIIISTMADHIFNFIDPAWFFGHRHYKLKHVNKILKDSGFQAVEILQIGNLYWDLDLLAFYIYKRILKNKYQTNQSMALSN